MFKDLEYKQRTEPQEDAHVCNSETERGSSPADVATHLANERTFLAWSFIVWLIIGSGILLARVLLALNSTKLMATEDSIPFYLRPTTMGLAFMAAGVIVELLAACRYLTVQRQIIEHRYRPSSTLALWFFAIFLMLCLVMAGYLLQIRGTP